MRFTCENLFSAPCVGPVVTNDPKHMAILNYTISELSCNQYSVTLHHTLTSDVRPRAPHYCSRTPAVCWCVCVCVYIVRSQKREPTYNVCSNRFVRTKMLDLICKRFNFTVKTRFRVRSILE